MNRTALMSAVLLCCACGPVEEPVDSVSADLLTEEVEWVLNPAEPNGHRGPDDTNCTFPIGVLCEFEAPEGHAESLCWERRAGHARTVPGLTLYKVVASGLHCRGLPLCLASTGGSGDLWETRLCVRKPDGTPGAGVQTVCGITGPRGCVPCGAFTVTCHE